MSSFVMRMLGSRNVSQAGRIPRPTTPRGHCARPVLLCLIEVRIIGRTSLMCGSQEKRRINCNLLGRLPKISSARGSWRSSRSPTSAWNSMGHRENFGSPWNPTIDSFDRNLSRKGIRLAMTNISMQSLSATLLYGTSSWILAIGIEALGEWELAMIYCGDRAIRGYLCAEGFTCAW